MNKQLEQGLVDVLNTFAQAKDFTMEQAPDVVQQMLAYKLFTGAAQVVIGTLIIVLSLWATKYFWKDSGGEVLLPASIMTVVGLCILCSSDFWMAYFAPKVYILQYVANLI